MLNNRLGEILMSSTNCLIDDLHIVTAGVEAEDKTERHFDWEM